MKEPPKGGKALQGHTNGDAMSEAAPSMTATNDVRAGRECQGRRRKLGEARPDLQGEECPLCLSRRTYLPGSL